MIIDCPNCGVLQVKGFLMGNVSGVVFEGCTQQCPQCGAQAPVRDGEYEYAKDILKSFLAAGATPDQLVEFGRIADAVRGGALSVSDAEREISYLPQVFSDAWAALGRNSPQISVLAAVAAACLTGATYYETIAQSAEVNSDAVADRAIEERRIDAMQSQTAAIGRQADIMQQSLEQDKQAHLMAMEYLSVLRDRERSGGK